MLLKSVMYHLYGELTCLCKCIMALSRYGMVMEKEIGVCEINGEYRGRCSVHLDAIYWVKRDSYLPQGSQGLKAVTRAKLGYDPVEVS